MNAIFEKKNVFCFVLNLQQHQNVKVSCLCAIYKQSITELILAKLFILKVMIKLN